MTKGSKRERNSLRSKEEEVGKGEKWIQNVGMEQEGRDKNL